MSLFQRNAPIGSELEIHHHRRKNIVKTPYAQYFKIVLRSVDRDSGTSKTLARFSNVTLPDFFHKQAVLLVESFVCTSGDMGSVELHLPELLQPRSYNSKTKGASDTLATFTGDYQNGSVNVDTLGVPITDQSFFQNKNLTIYFTNPTNGSVATPTGEWVLTLAIASLDESLPY